MAPTPFNDDSTDALIANRLPAWLTRAPLDMLYALHQSQHWQQQVQQQLHELLAQITPLDAFAEPRLQAALAMTVDTRQAQLRRRTLQRFPSFIAHIPDGIKEQVFQHSLLASALHNFTEAESSASAIQRGTAVLDAQGQALGISPDAFMKLCRTLDLGGQYQAHLRAHLTPDGEAGQQVEALMEEGFRANLEAALRLSLVNGEIAPHAYEHCAPLVAMVSARPSSIHGLEPRQIRLFGQRVRGVVGFEVRHENKPDEALEGVLCWIPDDPHGPLTWFSDWEALFLTLGKQFRLPGYIEFFQRFIGDRDREAYTKALDKAVQGVGQDVPLQLDGRHAIIDGPLFAFLRQQQIDTLLDNAKVHAVPTAQVDAKVRDQRLHFYLHFGFDLLGLASFALPALALPLLGITAMQVADEVYEGYADWQLGDRQAALEHLYGVAETVIMTAANAGAGVASHRLARAAMIDELVPVRASSGTLKLCDPQLPGYAVKAHGAIGELVDVEGSQYLRTPVASHVTSFDAETQQRRIRHPLRTDAYAPLLEGNAAGGWHHELENPREWQHNVELLQDLCGDWAQLDDQAVHEVLQATGISDDQLRRLHVEHSPPPARLVDAVQRQQLHAQFPLLRDEGFELHLQGQQPRPSADEILLLRSFPGLTGNAAREIIEHADEDLIERMHARQQVPLALAEQARWHLRDARMDRACAGLLQAAAINRDSEQLALGLIAGRAPWRGVRIEIRSGTLAGEKTAWVGDAGANDVRTVLRTSRGYQALDAAGQLMSSSNADDSFCQALLLQLDAWQKRALGDAANTPQLLAETLSQWACAHRERVAMILGMAPVGLGFRPPARLGDGRLGYPLSGRGENSNRALRRGILRLFPDYDDAAVEGFTASARALGLTPWNYYLRLNEQLQALDRALGQWRRQSSGPVQLIRRARIARRIRHAWQQRVRDDNANLVLTLEGVRVGSLPDLPPTVNFDHVSLLTLRNLGLGAVNEQFLARFPNLTRLDLSRNRLTEIPEIARVQQLGQVDLRDNRIEEVSEAQAALLRASPERVFLHGNPLSATARERLSTLAPPVVALPASEQQAWFEGLSEAEATRRREQWQALRAEPASDAFFEFLAAVREGDEFTRHPQDLRRRVAELLNAMYHHTHVRRALFEQAARPRGVADFDALVVSMQVALRTEGVRGRRVERELRNLGRELFRLDQLNRFAARHIERLRRLPGEVNEEEIYLAFRVALAEPLNIDGQPTYMNFQRVEQVTWQDLAEAEAAVYEAETASALSAFLAQQTFWQDHVRVEHPERFATLRQSYSAQLAALVPEQGQDHAPSEAVNQIVAQRRRAEEALVLELARGTHWTWYRLGPPHEPGSRAFAYLSRQLEQSLASWRGQPGDAEYSARSHVAGMLRELWRASYRGDVPALNTSVDHLCVSSLPELPAGITFERLRSLSFSNQQMLTFSGEFLRRFPNLEEVDLSGNRLSSFEGFEHLPRLRRLNVGGNLIETLVGLEHASQLEDLDLSGNQLGNLPAGAERLTNLVNLDLSFNRIDVLDVRIGQLASLQDLQLRGNLLSTVPSSIGDLTQLSVLDLGANQLSAVPEHLNGLHRLTQLYLHDNFITLDNAGERRLEGFSRLQILSLAGNPLLTAPRLRFNVHLYYLSLRGTGLRTLPLALLQAHSDLLVDLRGNRIAALSDEALSWVEAHPARVNLEQNPLSAQVLGRIRDALARVQAEWALAGGGGEVQAGRKSPSRKG